MGPPFEGDEALPVQVEAVTGELDVLAKHALVELYGLPRVGSRTQNEVISGCACRVSG